MKFNNVKKNIGSLNHFTFFNKGKKMYRSTQKKNKKTIQETERRIVSERFTNAIG